MAGRGDSVGSCVDEESSSSSFETSKEVLSCADANIVITWIRPVGESREDAFWKRFYFPLYVSVSFSSSGPQFVAYTNRDRGVMNSIY